LPDGWEIMSEEYDHCRVELSDLNPDSLIRTTGSVVKGRTSLQAALLMCVKMGESNGREKEVKEDEENLFIRVLRDVVIAVAYLIGTAIVEAVNSQLFHHHAPSIVGVVLRIIELTFIVALFTTLLHTVGSLIFEGIHIISDTRKALGELS
jgi:hypothetical protein